VPLRGAAHTAALRAHLWALAFAAHASLLSRAGWWKSRVAYAHANMDRPCGGVRTHISLHNSTQGRNFEGWRRRKAQKPAAARGLP